MIGYIKGKVVEIGVDYIILESNNIGYKLNTSSNTIAQMQLDEERKVFTKMIVREDDISLCGFATKDEEEMFKLLISVSKIGTKVAMGILSFAKPSEINRYIVSDDINSLSKAPGVGKKTAQRMVLELKDKIKKLSFEDSEQIEIETSENVLGDEDGAVEALIQLGYSKAEAREAIMFVRQPGMQLEDIIKKALEYIMKTSIKF